MSIYEGTGSGRGAEEQRNANCSFVNKAAPFVLVSTREEAQ